MNVYRITRKRYEKQVLNGEGGRKVASRWNYKGDAITYTSATRALALLEMLVHMDMEDMRRMNLVMCEVNIPESIKIQTISNKAMPENWAYTPFTKGPQSYWHEFILARKSAVLRVPSIIIPEEWNYLINPGHSDADKIKVSSCSSLTSVWSEITQCLFGGRSSQFSPMNMLINIGVFSTITGVDAVF